MILPPIELLKSGGNEMEILTFDPHNLSRTFSSTPNSEQSSIAKTVIKTFASFRIDTEIDRAVRGPFVTRYELLVPNDVRIAKIASLADNVASALAVEQVLMYRHPQKENRIVVEVPNKVRRTVRLREVLEDPSYYDHIGSIPVALGQRSDGSGVTIDLAEAPHLLIGGCTGSGKSVALHSIITSLLMRYGPAQVQLVLVDSKRIEMNVYKDLPHLALPVVDEPQQGVLALESLLREISNRTKILEDAGAQNIEEFTRQGQHMTRIVFVIDELADLILACGKRAEEPLTRCAALGRAVGAHLIVATQRPDVKVITGLIKANFPTRLGMRTATKMDSRVILDQNGAETLLGCGDALLLSPLSTKPERVHSAYVSREEVKRIVEHYRQQDRSR